MIEFLCIGRKTGLPYRRLIRRADILLVAESPKTKEVVLFFNAPKVSFLKKRCYVFLAETFEDAKKKILPLSA